MGHLFNGAHLSRNDSVRTGSATVPVATVGVLADCPWRNESNQTVRVGNAEMFSAGRQKLRARRPRSRKQLHRSGLAVRQEDGVIVRSDVSRPKASTMVAEGSALGRDLHKVISPCRDGPNTTRSF